MCIVREPDPCLDSRSTVAAAAVSGGNVLGHDSGGPNFFDYAGTRLLAAVTITGDTPCRATNVVYRLDTASARQFLSAYVRLP